ncbi:MAG: flagellar hook assembly protein FlgD [Gammaproteobacteria bacterium]|nr:MAG: flagellar hook assembly protein FlgD [Gammaproteobacteria bacterium]
MQANFDTGLMKELGLAPPQAREGARPRDRLGQEDFLKLMTTQLRMQSPLKPLENGQFLAQMAQFSSVKGIQELTASFAKLADALSAARALQAAAMVGREVMVPGSALSLQDGGRARGAVELPAASGQVVVRVLDASGQLVRRLELGARPAGLVPFTWDGTTEAGEPAASGSYRFEAQALVGGEMQAVKGYRLARVQSVALGGEQGVRLQLEDGEQAELARVRQIF